MSELIDIPVTQAMDWGSLNFPADPVGVLRIPEAMEEYIAASIGFTEWRLYATTVDMHSGMKLRTVSFAAVPCESKPQSPPIEVIRNDQTMTTQARIARRYRVVTNGEKFAVQYRRRWWSRWECRGRLDQGRVQAWEYDTADEARAARARLVQNNCEAARKWVPVEEAKP